MKTNELKVRIPQFKEEVDLANPPEGLEIAVMDAFKRYTSGTAKAYRYEDKLMFLDVFRTNIYESIYGNDDEEAVTNEVLKYCDYTLRETGVLPENDEVFDMEFMTDVYHKGFRPFRFREGILSEKAEETVRKTILRVITAVVLCEED